MSRTGAKLFRFGNLSSRRPHDTVAAQMQERRTVAQAHGVAWIGGGTYSCARVLYVLVGATPGAVRHRRVHAPGDASPCPQSYILSRGPAFRDTSLGCCSRLLPCGVRRPDSDIDSPKGFAIYWARGASDDSGFHTKATSQGARSHT
jgi:hypothetical protein